MEKELRRAVLALLIIALFGLLIYPGLYKYDKLEGKYPVRMNRITGETKILREDGWVKEGADVANTAGDAKGQQATKQDLAALRDEIRSELLQEMQSKLNQAKADWIASKSPTGPVYEDGTSVLPSPNASAGAEDGK
ncbi:hypothetical protein KIH86_26130 [Paenibacillus sp. HN-1]|uniref:hypothetical protein n=1 Tax=Paenibacillus TaxID=44249 RepID=UPI001CA96307|nr:MULTISPECIES: hypothetical protein [Paenibacillus]MBY9081548.1 hypothetical protein [Paenibacillus sp. CGMCC 1.18879]MBY9087671.1 hypothetical protein [Paenibacillus sinensis]